MCEVSEKATAVDTKPISVCRGPEGVGAAGPREKAPIPRCATSQRAPRCAGESC